MKKLTKTGEQFIRTICLGTRNNLIVGNYAYKLPFSTLTGVTKFTSNIINKNGGNVASNEALGEELIYLFNKYGSEANIDSNVLAAQAYIDSGYRSWHYSKFDSGSGIASIQAIRVFSHIVKSTTPTTYEGLGGLQFPTSEVTLITIGLTASTNESSYVYIGANSTTSSIAVGNRKILHQNIIDNPEQTIKAQASIMKEILERNNGLTANALFAYKRYWLMASSSYPKLLDDAGKEYGDQFVKVGVDYVEKVFRCLGDKNNNKTNKPIDKPVGAWFGYDIDFTIDKFKAYLG